MLPTKIFPALLMLLICAQIFTCQTAQSQVQTHPNSQATRTTPPDVPANTEVAWKQLREVIVSHFDAWANGSAQLSLQQVGKLEKDPSITGRQAAALGIIAQYMTGKIYKDEGIEPRLTQEQLLAGLKDAGAPIHFLNIMKELSGDVVYENQLRLYGQGGKPSTSTAGIYQSNIGDCYALSAIESVLTFSGPGYIQKLIHANGNNNFTVSLPGAHPVTFTLTEAEIAQGNVDIAEHGCWLQVLNKAIDNLIVESYKPATNPVRRKKQLHFEQTTMGWLENGVTQLKVLHWLTNEDYMSVYRLRPQQWNAEHLNRFLSKAAAAHLPVGVYTPDHSLAIVGFDQTSKIVTVMNPWGTSGNYRPKHGGEKFSMTKGRFQLWLPQLLDNFQGLNFPRTIAGEDRNS